MIQVKTNTVAINEMSDIANGLQHNSRHHLRQRTGEHQPEQKQDQLETDTELASSRQDEDSSEERSSDNHTTLTQHVATTGMLGWIQGFLRHRLFGLIPPLGL